MLLYLRAEWVPLVSLYHYSWHQENQGSYLRPSTYLSGTLHKGALLNLDLTLPKEQVLICDCISTVFTEKSVMLLWQWFWSCLLLPSGISIRLIETFPSDDVTYLKVLHRYLYLCRPHIYKMNYDSELCHSVIVLAIQTSIHQRKGFFKSKLLRERKKGD